MHAATLNDTDTGGLFSSDPVEVFCFAGLFRGVIGQWVAAVFERNLPVHTQGAQVLSMLVCIVFGLDRDRMRMALDVQSIGAGEMFVAKFHPSRGDNQRVDLFHEAPLFLAAQNSSIVCLFGLWAVISFRFVMALFWVSLMPIKGWMFHQQASFCGLWKLSVLRNFGVPMFFIHDVNHFANNERGALPLLA